MHIIYKTLFKHQGTRWLRPRIRIFTWDIHGKRTNNLDASSRQKRTGFNSNCSSWDRLHVVCFHTLFTQHFNHTCFKAKLANLFDVKTLNMNKYRWLSNILWIFTSNCTGWRTPLISLLHSFYFSRNKLQESGTHQQKLAIYHMSALIYPLKESNGNRKPTN